MRARSQAHLLTSLALLAVGFLLLFPFDLLFSSDEESPLWRLPHVDKLVHFTIFMALVPVIRRSFLLWRPRRATADAFLASTAYGALLETLQRWVPGRDATWPDLAANVLGAACAATALFAWIRSR